jgi:NhaA family Na+:H+ antiporter
LETQPTNTTKLFTQFFESEKAGGIVLVVVTLLSLVFANSIYQTHYISFWTQEIGSHSLVDWINDGLMAIFFLLIGLELEREVYIGELSNVKSAALPLFGAFGGMIIPAGIYLLFNFGTATQSGAGIPMATDIAFAVGILSLLGNRVPTSLKVFLTALAVIDDLGAIFVIAIFYTKSISFYHLGIAFSIWIVLLAFNRLKVRNLFPYLIGGFIMWYFMMQTGVHATITGVLVAFAIPFGNGDEKSTSYILQEFLHSPVAFFILPLFALANTAITLGDHLLDGLSHASSIGIMLGLVLGKPLGIWLLSYGAAAVGLCSLPSDLKWKNIAGAGFLGGIGFTMSIFITLLAFEHEEVINHSKIAILLASVIAGSIGFLFLKYTLKK